jgi:hypothetical protein
MLVLTKEETRQASSIKNDCGFSAVEKTESNNSTKQDQRTCLFKTALPICEN